MTYSVDISGSDRAVSPAFTYDAVAKTLTAVDSRVAFESGADYFAIKISGDYSFVVDEDGVLCGDMQHAVSPTFPRLDIVAVGNGMRRHLGSITQNGMLSIDGVTEADELPAGMNIKDMVVFTPARLTATKINEVWFLADNGNYVCSNGLLIRVQP